MNIDHNVNNTATPTMLCCFDLSRFAEKEKGREVHRGCIRLGHHDQWMASGEIPTSLSSAGFRQSYLLSLGVYSLWRSRSEYVQVFFSDVD
jgi:hypothetical protein